MRLPADDNQLLKYSEENRDTSIVYGVKLRAFAHRANIRLFVCSRDRRFMSREFPDWVNPWKASEGNRIFRGTIALGKMTRLVPLLVDSAGEASFEASFSFDELGFATIKLRVNAELPLVCQASRERFLFRVMRESQLLVIDDMEQQEHIPGYYETVLVEEKRLQFLKLVQDELILEVPQVPRKPGIGDIRYSTDPDEQFAVAREEQDKPFAALGVLLQSEHKDSKKD